MKIADLLASFPSQINDYKDKTSAVEKWAKVQADKLIADTFNLAQQRNCQYRDSIIPIVNDAKNQWESVCHRLFGNDTSLGHLKYIFQKRLIKACLEKNDQKWKDVCKHFFPERYQKVAEAFAAVPFWKR